MTPTILQALTESIGIAYAVLQEAVEASFNANELVIAARSALDAGRATLLLDGRLDGKNEAQREAQARRLLDRDFATLEADEAAARRAKHQMDMARLQVEALRTQVRLLELEATAAA